MATALHFDTPIHFKRWADSKGVLHDALMECGTQSLKLWSKRRLPDLEKLKAEDDAARAYEASAELEEGDAPEADDPEVENARVEHSHRMTHVAGFEPEEVEQRVSARLNAISACQEQDQHGRTPRSLAGKDGRK
jgi:hypothetical protein